VSSPGTDRQLADYEGWLHRRLSHPHTDAGVPKYLNSPATVLYEKGRTLFGLWEVRPALAQVPSTPVARLSG
jgi:DNA primase